MSTIPALTHIHNGLIQRVMPAGGTRDWQFRAYSDHRNGSHLAPEYFDFLTMGAAIFYLWLLDEIHESVRRRTTSHSE